MLDHSEAWKRFDRDQHRRNRLRLIRNGTIVPAYGMKPQMMLKTTEGTQSWVPEIKRS